MDSFHSAGVSLASSSTELLSSVSGIVSTIDWGNVVGLTVAGSVLAITAVGMYAGIKAEQEERMEYEALNSTDSTQLNK